jgi:hypothetical protein
MRLAVVSAIGAAAALGACSGPYAATAPGVDVAANAPAGIASGCIRSSQIGNHSIVDDHTLYIDVRGRGIYRITTSGSCLAGAISSDPIILRQVPSTNLICRPIDLDLSVSKGGAATRCITQSITRLTPQEMAAIPRKLRP